MKIIIETKYSRVEVEEKMDNSDTAHISQVIILVKQALLASGFAESTVEEYFINE